MSLANELAALFRRDLTKLRQQLEAFPDDATLWKTLPGIGNSAGNLVLHLEGNLREFIGRQLGGVSYQRRRDQEFEETSLTLAELRQRIESVRELVPSVLAALSPAQLEAAYPQKHEGALIPTQQFVIHLHGHLNYHLGQIDYLRRIVTAGAAVEYAGL